MSNPVNTRRGILIFAIGHPYYGRLAFNLAMSIKATESFPVAVVYSERSLSHLSEKQKSFFDILIFIPEEEAKGFGSKLQADLLSPFEETLLLDADMAWLPSAPPTKLFEELCELEYTGITEGYYDYNTKSREHANKAYYFWAEPEEVKEKYALECERLYQWRSEVIYFKKTERVQKFFKLAREIHADHGLQSVKLFGEQVPDELAINISAAVHGIEPHEFKWMPALWTRLHGVNVAPFAELYSNYYLLSCGSNYSTPDVRKLYDRIIKTAAYKFKMEHLFTLLNKKDIIPERIKM